MTQTVPVPDPGRRLDPSAPGYPTPQALSGHPDGLSAEPIAWVGSTEPAPSPDHFVQRLYADHAGELLRFVTRGVGGDVQSAEDIVQETIVRAWNNRSRFDSVRSARPWLFTVARRLMIDQGRRRATRVEQVGAPARDDPSGEDHANRTLSHLVILDALDALTPAQRAVIVELYFRAASVREAAERLDIPEGTVKSRCFHALRRLRAVLVDSGLDSSE